MPERKNSPYTGAILAAGRGSRMAPFSENCPKPLLPICNRPLIEHQIEIMRSIGITDIVVLVGHKGFEISRHLGDGSALGVNIRYAEQSQALGIAHAVGRLEGLIDKPFLLFLGDIFFIPGEIQSMFDLFEEQGGGAVLATKEERDPSAIRKNYALRLDEGGYVKRVIEKPRHTFNTLKGVGLYLFDLTIFDAIRRTPRTAMRDEYEITESIQVLIDDGLPVRPSNSIVDDINLTTPSDLLFCNLMRARLTGGSLIGQNLRAPDGSEVTQSVIGSNVEIQHPISISQSVIFDNTVVRAASGFHRYILTPEIQVDCSHGLTPAQLSDWS
ncbi:MAG: NTP transferase domain-containing protein [Bryobacterales bacterium]|nr:NTP transferase domain-containing protein [Bryobacterales bacterium]